MKIRFIKYVKYCIPVLLLGACKKNMTDLNHNGKVATTVKGEMLFSNAEKAFADVMTTPNVNTGIFELVSQYWAETTYPQESQYDLGNRNIPLNWWNALYRDVIQDFNQSIVLMRQEQTDPTLLPADKLAFKNKIAIAKVFRAYAFSVLVNTFGDIPYSEALQGRLNTTPKYDNQKTVYYALMDTINASIGEMDVTGGSFDGADLVYSGDMEKWYKFANSIKLKLGMIIADSDPARSKTEVEGAAPHVFESNDDNALLPYTNTPPNVNPIWTNLVQSGRNDFVAANTLVDTMNARNDPRRPFYFTMAGATGRFIGGTYGAGNAFKNFSHPSAKVESADFPAILMDDAEVELLLAEGAARGMNVGGTAAEHYDKGVTASIEFWGGTAADAAAYLANPVNQYDPVNWKKSIGVQAWINYYTRGFDAWIEQRRLDYPQLIAPPAAKTAFPVRYTYPTTEENLNPNYAAAATAIGGDAVTTKLFWDKY
ncbi:MAG: SusD/RagB family nutrient-binding outer membrane lipoprotein [Flavisolibacter sp.]